MTKDLFGKALLDYQKGNYSEDIVTWTNISEEDVLPLPYLFRHFSEMPKIEQKALQLCKGKVLDVGCGAGSHSLWLQKHEYNVKAIDSSKGAIEVAKIRGIVGIEHKSFLEETERFDSILLLMNGTGIFQTLKHTPIYLSHLKSLLNPNGQILIDSSDIIYLYASEDEIEIETETEIEKFKQSDRAPCLPTGRQSRPFDENESEPLKQLKNSRYYGELDYYLSYKGEEEAPMKWLYLDFDTLYTACQTVGLHCEKVMDGEHFDYLAKLTLA